MIKTKKLAIFLICTKNELINDRVQKCLDKFFNSKTSKKYCVDLHLSFNQFDKCFEKQLLKLNLHENIHNVYIHDHQLTGQHDYYYPDIKDVPKDVLNNLSLMGLSSGPNNLFFLSLHLFFQTKYRDILILECDTKPIRDYWLDKIINFCDKNEFMIAGSLYKGKQKLDIYAEWTGHLNGVAIYRRSKHFEEFSNECIKLIQHQIAHGQTPFLTFDCALYKLYSTLYGQSNYNYTSKSHQMKICPLISNYSIKSDSNISVNEILEEHPETVILHQKLN